MKIIDKFEGDFDFLSNFSPHSFRDHAGVKWETNEHYYQAMKTVNMLERGKIWSAPTPGIAKRIGQNITMRYNWANVRVGCMFEGVGMKFEQNKDIKDLLISTKGYELIEGNNWHDNIWGDCDCPKCENITGKNLLGKVLMLVRRNYIDGE